MNAQQLRAEHQRILSLSEIEVLAEKENIKELIKNLLLYASDLKTKKVRQQYLNFSSQLTKLLEIENFYTTSYENQVSDNPGADKQSGFLNDAKFNYSIHKSIHTIGAEEISVSEDVTMLNMHDDGYIFNPKDTNPFCYTSDLTVLDPQALTKEEQLSEEEITQFNEVLTIAVKEFKLIDLLDAYLSNMWRDNATKWNGRKLEKEVKFLNFIDRELEVDIEIFGAQLPNVILQELTYSNQSIEDIPIEDFFYTCLNLEHVEIRGNNLKESYEALTQFLSPENYHTKGYDAIKFDLKSGAKTGALSDLNNAIVQSETDFLAIISQRMWTVLHFIERAKQQGDIITVVKYEHLTEIPKGYVTQG